MRQWNECIPCDYVKDLFQVMDCLGPVPCCYQLKIHPLIHHGTGDGQRLLSDTDTVTVDLD